jgi:hypothetical protein
VTGCRVADNARAGIACFGCAARVGQSTFECNVVDLDAELVNDTSGVAEPSFLDLGGNTCGCGDPEQCIVLSANLEAPTVSGR